MFDTWIVALSLMSWSLISMGSGILQRIKTACRWLWCVTFIITVALHLIFAMTEIPASTLINNGVYQIASIGFSTQVVGLLPLVTDTSLIGGVTANSNYGQSVQVCPRCLSIQFTFDDCAWEPFRSLVSGTS